MMLLTCFATIDHLSSTSCILLLIGHYMMDTADAVDLGYNSSTALMYCLHIHADNDEQLLDPG